MIDVKKLNFVDLVPVSKTTNFIDVTDLDFDYTNKLAVDVHIKYDIIKSALKTALSIKDFIFFSNEYDVQKSLITAWNDSIKEGEFIVTQPNPNMGDVEKSASDDLNMEDLNINADANSIPMEENDSVLYLIVIPLTINSFRAILMGKRYYTDKFAPNHSHTIHIAFETDIQGVSTVEANNKQLSSTVYQAKSKVISTFKCDGSYMSFVNHFLPKTKHIYLIRNAIKQVSPLFKDYLENKNNIYFISKTPGAKCFTLVEILSSKQSKTFLDCIVKKTYIKTDIYFPFVSETEQGLFKYYFSDTKERTYAGWFTECGVGVQSKEDALLEEEVPFFNYNHNNFTKAFVSSSELGFPKNFREKDN